jgi:sugar (glycoside-pentoside-hexuronide) transporter
MSEVKVGTNIQEIDSKHVQGHLEGTKLSFSEKFAYGSGDMANNLIGQMILVYLMFFYTDIYGLSAAFAGTMFLVVRIIDAVFDLGMGVLVDKTHTRWGKLRPYLLFGAVPFGALAVLCFTTPNFGLAGKEIYAYITYILLSLMTSVIGIPYSALTSAMTQDGNERVSLSTFRMIFAAIGGIAVTVIVPIIAPKVGNGDLKLGYSLAMLILAVVGVALLFFTFSKTKERYTNQSHESVPFKIMVKTTLGNRLLLLLCLCVTFVVGSTNIRASVIVYYLTYNLKRPELISVYFLGLYATIILGMVFVPFFSKRMGRRMAFIAGLVFFAITNGIIYFIPYSNIPLFLTVTLLSGLATSFTSVLLWGLLPDTVEYAEWKYGVRTEGVIFSFNSFAQKMATAIGGAIPGFVLAFTGYVPGGDQSASALNGIALMMSLIPSALIAISAIVMLFYNMDDRKYASIVEELKERKTVTK